MNNAKKHLENNIDDLISLLQAMREYHGNNPDIQLERLRQLTDNIYYNYKYVYNRIPVKAN